MAPSEELRASCASLLEAISAMPVALATKACLPSTYLADAAAKQPDATADDPPAPSTAPNTSAANGLSGDQAESVSAATHARASQDHKVSEPAAAAAEAMAGKARSHVAEPSELQDQRAAAVGRCEAANGGVDAGQSLQARQQADEEEWFEEFFGTTSAAAVGQAAQSKTPPSQEAVSKLIGGGYPETESVVAGLPSKAIDLGTEESTATGPGRTAGKDSSHDEEDGWFDDFFSSSGKVESKEPMVKRPAEDKIALEAKSLSTALLITRQAWDANWSHPCAGQKRADGSAIFCYWDRDSGFTGH
eukprot:TRINITY_DN27306_c0_g1_i2.p1 TRINITY_DN27306_c0_g1~~TRINITY_DN27306_c0_g1_i2.p1  ORF type:complete len:343 (-),score=73.67 TRINITY_DN27306_c0_g1_i2:98-1009(-)